MVDSVNGAGHVGRGRITDSKRAGSKKGESVKESKPVARETDDMVSGDLQELVGQIRKADDVRKNRVHEVKEMMRNGELLTPEAIRNAAERLLSEEL